MGKGYLMPLPVPPLELISSLMLPTPMASEQSELPIRAELYDANGIKLAEQFMGRLKKK